jgi:hypothetical protein
MKRTLTLAAMFTLLASTSALAQTAGSVITAAERALGNVNSVTYSGAARNVAFQQCGANATAMICHGMHDPMRPVMNYVRVLDLGTMASRSAGETLNVGGGGSTAITPGTFFEQVTP